MSSITLHTAYFYKGDIIPCSVEVTATDGIGIHIIGIPDARTKETLLRVVTALDANGYSLPGKKIVIRIEPHGGELEWAGAFRPSECSQAYDVAIALSILIACDKIPRPTWNVDNVLFFAGLKLDGRLIQPYTGIDGGSAAAVLSYLLRKTWKLFVGYPTIPLPLWFGAPTLGRLIEDLDTILH